MVEDTGKGWREDTVLGRVVSPWSSPLPHRSKSCLLHRGHQETRKCPTRPYPGWDAPKPRASSRNATPSEHKSSISVVLLSPDALVPHRREPWTRAELLGLGWGCSVT